MHRDGSARADCDALRSDSSPIVISGIGLACLQGLSASEAFEAVIGESRPFATMTAMESDLPAGAEGGQAMELAADFAPGLPREARYLRWVATQALTQAHLAPGPSNRSLRIAAVLGTTLHGIRAGGRYLRTDDAGQLVSFLAGATAHLALDGLGIDAGRFTNCSACSSALGAVALASTMIESGQADVVLAGGYDAISEYAWAGFNSLRLISPGDVRPFASDRRGMKIAEGYCLLVIERAATAESRGATPIVSVAGWGESADAHHLTQPQPNGSGAAAAMRRAMNAASCEASELGMVVAHATATADNDASEHAALATVLGEQLSRVPVTGLKSHLGHTLGGAGAVELGLAALAVRRGIVIPTRGVREQDVEFPGLRLATSTLPPMTSPTSMNISLGFGGANTCVVVRGVPARPRPPIETARVCVTGIGVVLPGITGREALSRSDPRGAPRTFDPAARRTLPDDQLAAVIDARRSRRLSGYVKGMLACTSLAVRDAGLGADQIARMSAILASTHGSPSFCFDYYDQIVRSGVMAANPVLFAEGVPNAAAAHVSATLGIRGGCQTVIGTRSAGLEALFLAFGRVATGATDCVIVGASEETHPTVDRAYRENGLGAGATKGMVGRSGIVAAPGGVAMVIESEASALHRGVRPMAVVSHVGASSASGVVESLREAVRAVMASACDRVLGSDDSTWMGRAERAAIRRLRGRGARPMHENLTRTVGELFSAGPLLNIAWQLERSGSEAFVSVGADWDGSAVAVRIEPRERSGDSR